MKLQMLGPGYKTLREEGRLHISALGQMLTCTPTADMVAASWPRVEVLSPGLTGVAAATHWLGKRKLTVESWTCFA